MRCRPTLILAGIVAFSLLAAACATAPPPVPAGQTAAPAPKTAGTPAAAQPPTRPTGTLRVGLTALPPSMDATVRGSSGPWAYPHYQVFDALTIMSEDAQQEMPALAQSWRMVTPDTWEFTLRDGARWQDGTPVTSADVEFSLRRVIGNQRAQVTTRIRGLRDVQVVDARTVRIITPTPDAMLPRLMSLMDILPKAAFERLGEQGFGSAPVGTGPFRVTSFNPQQEVVMVAHEGSWRGTPRLQEVRFSLIEDTSTRVAALRSGGIDIAARPPTDGAPGLREEGFPIVTQNGSAWIFEMSPTQFPDRRVRQAMNFAVNKDVLTDRIFGGLARPLDGQALVPGTFGFNPGLRPYPHDVARSRQLLQQVGSPVSVKIKYVATDPELPTVAQAIQQSMREAGFEVEIQQLEVGRYFDEFLDPARRDGIYLSAVTSPDMDGLTVIQRYLSNNSRRLYNNPEYDRLLNAAASELDLARRSQLTQQAVQVMHDDPPIVFLYSVSDSYILARNVREFTVPRSARWYLDKTWLAPERG